MDEKITMEMLSAYVDGELDDAAARDVERAMARDAGIRSEVQSLRECDAALRAALAAPAREHPPERLVNVIEDGFAARAARRRPKITRIALPLAASIALVTVAGLAGYMASGYRVDQAVELALKAQEQEKRILAGTVNQALETKVSGQPVSWEAPDTGKRGAITPVRTYRSKSGHWCREYRIQVTAVGKNRSWKGVACRTPKNGWITVEERYHEP